MKYEPGQGDDINLFFISYLPPDGSNVEFSLSKEKAFYQNPSGDKVNFELQKYYPFNGSDVDFSFSNLISIDDSVKENVFVAESKSELIEPKITSKQKITAEIASSISVLNEPSIKQRIFIAPPVANSISKMNRAIVYNRIAVKLQVECAKSMSRANIPDLAYNGGCLLTSKISVSGSEMFAPAIATGQPVIINVGMAISKSQLMGPILHFNIFEMIDINDDVYLLVNGINGNKKIYHGKVRSRGPRDRILTVKAILGDGILSERIVKEDYPEQDVGLTAKQIIDKYCAPLTTTNINTETGIIAQIPANGKTALSVFENIRRNHGVLYYVDHKWDVHLYLEDDIEGSNFYSDDNRGYKIRLGDY